MNQNPGRKLDRYLVSLILLGLMGLTAFLYLETRTFSFLNFDDPHYVYENHLVIGGLSLENAARAFTTAPAGQWLPLLWLSFMLDSSLFGMDPGAFHLVNVLFHFFNVLLAFWIFFTITKAPLKSAFIAFILAAHPTHVESVAWVVERKDVLSTFFLFLAILAYARYCKRPSAGRYAMTALAMTFSLMAKSTAMTLPCVFLLLDFWPLKRFGRAGNDEPEESIERASLGRLVLEKLPLQALALVIVIINMLAFKAMTQDIGLDQVDFILRVKIAITSYAGYLLKFFHPHPLSVMFPRPEAVASASVITSLLILAAVTAFCLVLVRKRPYLLVGWLWFLGTLLPMSGLFILGPHAMADRYTYVPYLGLSLALAFGAWDISTHLGGFRGKAAYAILACTAIYYLAADTKDYVPKWKDNFTLYTHSLSVVKDNWPMENNLGAVLFQEGRVNEALVRFENSVRVKPHYSDAHNNMGVALDRLGRTPDAVDHFEKALKSQPGMAKARLNLAGILTRQGDYRAAGAHYEKVLSTDPDHPEALYRLGTLFLLQENPKAAAETYGKLLRADPGYPERLGNPDVFVNLASALLQTGRTEGAKALYGEALKLKPGSAPALLGLGQALLELNEAMEAEAAFREALVRGADPARAEFFLGLSQVVQNKPLEAIPSFKKALAADPEFLAARLNLAVALSQTGKPEDAVEEYGKVLAQDPKNEMAIKNLGLLETGRERKGAR
ncbi:MAG: tetratricopeptide repeat protein [Deltaproteobacteria bacterium]|nr:tetratricopeptide repeat protein [Deltaproteobacteria bacterium]